MHQLGIVDTHLLCKNDKFYYVKKINLHIYTHHIIVYILLIKKTYFAIGIFKINCLTCTLKCSNLYIKLFINKYIDVVAWLLVYTCHYNNISCFNFQGDYDMVEAILFIDRNRLPRENHQPLSKSLTNLSSCIEHISPRTGIKLTTLGVIFRLYWSMLI